MYWINISDFVSVIQTLVALFSLIYAIRSVQDFINQKRIENQSADARRALDSLDELKNTLKHLCSFVNAAIEKEYIVVLAQIPHALNNIQNILKKLPNTSDQLIQELDKIIKDATRVPGDKATAILGAIDPEWEYIFGPNKKELGLERFEKLEKRLMEIYNIPENIYLYGLINIMKALGITIFVTFFFYVVLLLGLNTAKNFID